MPLCLLSFWLTVPPNQMAPGAPIRAGCLEPIPSGPTTTCTSIDQSINQSINPSVDQSTKHSIDQSTNQSTNQQNRW